MANLLIQNLVCHIAMNEVSDLNFAKQKLAGLFKTKNVPTVSLDFQLWHVTYDTRVKSNPFHALLTRVRINCPCLPVD